MRAWDINQSPRLYNVILRGPNTEKLDSQFLQTMQVGEGPQHREIGSVISTDNASWGRTAIKKYFFFRN
ncbi:nitrogen fixation protein NifR [Staphylococcus aureus]|nr:nitrogen fixation protein NifR [Staphylococcus aureus]PZH54336.1 nitrogen fixation protein NifR [Staphylococcus aureus]PZH73516.1 nitrogen fixation protein NifR [Staphylococcus aureus]PZI28126.1 nitrogen fixation protein NifR [Staphylococcus aureus]